MTFKATTPAAKLKTRMKPQAPPRPVSRALRGADASDLSLVAAYDDNRRNAKVLLEGDAEKEFRR